MTHSKTLAIFVLGLILFAAAAYVFYLAHDSSSSTEQNSATIAAIGETITLNGVSIKPLQVVEDSRCPVDVQCIQAGRVRLLVQVDATTATLILGIPQIIPGNQVTLTSTTPDKYSKIPLQPSDYRFTFSVGPIVN